MTWRELHSTVVTDNLTGDTVTPWTRCPECNGHAYGPAHCPWRRSERRPDGTWVTDSHCRCGRLRHHATFLVDTEPVDLLDLLSETA